MQPFNFSDLNLRKFKSENNPNTTHKDNIYIYPKPAQL